MTIDLDENTYSYLIKILDEKYYSTTDISELQKINNLYKILQFKSESWLSSIQPINSKNKKTIE